MTIKSGIFNSVNGDRRYKAEDFAAYFATFISNGVFPNPSTGLQAIANGNMTVTLKAGKGWINGYYIVNDDDYILTIDASDGALNRIDRIVLRLDYFNRSIAPAIKKGSYATSPVAPALKRDADAYELALADVYVGKGALVINQSNITDLRLNNALCGIVHAVVDQVDTTTIFNQYQSWFNMYSQQESSEWETWIAKFMETTDAWIRSEQLDFDTWRTNQEVDFITWFNQMKGQLSADAAGNLQLQIDEHNDAGLPHVFLDATDNKTYRYGFKTNTAKDGLIFVYEEVL